jgi:DNA repair protein RecO (recombination protein O)
MPEHRTRGLVLRTFDHGESDRLVHLYTEGMGRISAIAKGARRSRRRFPGALELFAALDLVLAENPRSGWLRVEAAQLERAHLGIATDLGRFAIACELVELLDRCAGERESNPELYRFALGVLGVLEDERPDRLLALLVATKTLAWLGFRPVLAACAVCGEPLAGRTGAVAFAVRHGGAACARCAAPEDEHVSPDLLLALEAGIRAPLRERGKLGLAERAVRQAESLLERFFRFHVGLEPRSREAVHALVAWSPASLDADTPPGNNARGPRAAGEGSAPPTPV